MSSPIPTHNEIEVKTVDIIVSKADEVGDITYANPIFYKLSGYSKKELNFQPHSILRHPDMPKIIFQYLWAELKKENEVHAFVKNLTKDGSFYWVMAYIRPALNPDGSFRNYVSTRKTMSSNARTIIEPLYKQLLEAEELNGTEASEKLLTETLDGKAFNDFMDALQDN